MSKEVAGEIRQRIGAKVRKLRKEQGLDQRDLAAAVGRDQSAISYIENGLVDARLETLTAIASVLGTTYEDLLKSDEAVA